jgi:adenylate cyclase
MQAEQLPPAVAAEVLRSQGDALEKQGQYAAALESLRAAEALCRAHLNDLPPLLLAAVYADMGQVLRRLGEFDEALEVCRGGLAIVRPDSRSADDERIAADLQMLMGALYATRGDYEAARFHFTNGLAAQESIDDLYGCARSHNNLGYLAQLQSDYVRAVRHYAEAETLARRVNAKFIMSSVLLNAAYGYYRLDRYDEAESACRDVLVLCAEMGEQDGMAKAHDMLGMIAFNRGRYSEARENYEHSLRVHRALGSYEEAYTLANLASVQLAEGELDAARRTALQALELARRVQSPQLEVEALNALAEVCLTEGDATLLDEAVELTETAVATAAQLGSRLDEGVACRLQGEIAAARGDAFMAPFETALAIFAAINSAFELARTEARYGEALAACNDPAAASYLKRAAETFKQIGAEGELRRLATIHERS